MQMAFIKKIWFISLIIAIFIAVLTITHSPLHIAGVGTDQAIYQYVGNTILNHGVPYRDAWDHKQPLTYMIHALGLLIGNHSLWGIWIIELFFLTVTGVFSFLLLKRLCNSWVSLIIVLSSLLAIWGLAGYYNPEQLALPFYMISIVFFASLMTTNVNLRKQNFYAFLIGVFTSACFFLKQSLISVGIAIVIVYFFDILLNKRWSKIASLIFMGLGFLAVTCMFVAYLGANHALQQYWEAAYQFNFMYSHTGLQEKLLSIVDALESISTYPGLFIVIPLWISVVILSLYMQVPRITHLIQKRNFQLVSLFIGSFLLIVIIGKYLLDNSTSLGVLKVVGVSIAVLLLLAAMLFTRNGKAILLLERVSRSQMTLQLHSLKKEVKALIYLTTVLVPITFYLNSLSGEHYDYYKITFFPSLILIIGVTLHLLLTTAKEGISRNLILLVMTSFFVGSSISPVVNLIGQYHLKPDLSFLEGIDFIKQNTKQNDPIYVWGTNTSIYIMADRESPTRYFYQLAAVAWEPYEKQFGVVKEILNSLTTNKPKLIVLPGTIHLGNDLPKCLDAADNYGNASPIFEFVCKNYQFVRDYSDFQIYALILSH